MFFLCHIKAKFFSAVTSLTSEVKVLSIANQREYFKPKKALIEFDEKTFFDDCKKHFGLLLIGTRTPAFEANTNFMMDIFDMKTIDKDNQPRRYYFDCQHCVSPASLMYGIFGQTLYAKAIMHELKVRLKSNKWISKNILEIPQKQNVGRLYYCYEEDYYVQRVVHDIIQEQKIKVFQFLFYLHKQYLNERQT